MSKRRGAALSAKKQFRIVLRVAGANLIVPPQTQPEPPKRTDFPLAA